MADALSISLGETRSVTIRVESTERKRFEVTNASFSLKHGNTTEATGACSVESDGQYAYLVSALVTPQIKCTMYTLQFSYDIYPERLLYDVFLRVR